MSGKWIVKFGGLVSIMLLAACAPTAGSNPADRQAMPAAAETSDPFAASGVRVDLPDLGNAPELQNDVWLNADHPLRLAELRGRVVLLDM